MSHRSKMLTHFTLFLVFGIVVAVVFVQSRGDDRPTTTDTKSSDLSDNEKIAFLRRYLKTYSDIEATEFHIIYHDNSGRGVPAPADYDLQVVMKIPKDKLPVWTAGLPQATDEVDLTWGYALLPKEGKWAVNSKPSVYQKGGSITAVFENEGILFKRVCSE